jgi:hypothetical protein
LRLARRLYRKPDVDGVYRLDEGALLDGFFPFLRALGGMVLRADVHGTAIQREILPYVLLVLCYGRKMLFGIERIHALLALLSSEEALKQLVGFKAQRVRAGVCQRGAAKRQWAREPGPICPETLAKQIVRLNWRGLESVCNGASRALAQAGALRLK